MDPPFTPSLELNRAFYTDVVAPLLGRRPHAAALLGWGSDVLGYDTARSVDHGWGPRLLLFVAEGEVAAVQQTVDSGLPESFRGWPVTYGWDDVRATHHVMITTISRWLTDHLGVDATTGMTTLDWLLTPQQRLLGVVGGEVYADPDGTLGTVRSQLAWYPDQVWRWLLGCQWRRLAQEEAFVNRTAEVGDETGSSVIAARLVRDVMRLALLMARRYAPYSKWLGTAFARLPHADRLDRHVSEAVRSTDLRQREAALCAAYSAAASRHNALQITEPLDPGTRPFHGRPACVLGADRFAEACLATVTNPELQQLAPVGAIDQVIDCTDVLEQPKQFRRLAALYHVS